MLIILFELSVIDFFCLPGFCVLCGDSSCRRAKCCVPFTLCETRRRQRAPPLQSLPRLPVAVPTVSVLPSEVAKLHLSCLSRSRHLPGFCLLTRHYRGQRLPRCCLHPTRIELRSHLEEPRAAACPVQNFLSVLPSMQKLKHRCRLLLHICQRQQRRRRRPKCFVRRGARTRSSRLSSGRCENIKYI